MLYLQGFNQRYIVTKERKMIERNVSLDLMEFVEKYILPRYSAFDRAHNLTHANRVIARSVRIAQTIGADVNIAYATAAYHDLGLEGPRAVHHLTSGRIVMGDPRLKRWFSNDQIKVIKEAVEDHRASASHAPRSIYGKIVAEADRDLEPESVFRRTIEFGLDHYPDKDKEEQWLRFCDHIANKYSQNGYIRLWIPGTENEKQLKQIRETAADATELRKTFERIYSALVTEN